MSATVKGTCPDKRVEIDMPIERIVLTVGTEMRYSFACTACGGAHTKPIERYDIILQLLDAGAVISGDVDQQLSELQ